MITKATNYSEWALLNYQLSDALEHLQKLVNETMTADDFDEIVFKINLAHVYGHLNRAWNMRNLERDMTSEEFKQFAEFPKDLNPS